MTSDPGINDTNFFYVPRHNFLLLKVTGSSRQISPHNRTGTFNTTVDIKLKQWAESQLPIKSVEVRTFVCEMPSFNIVTRDKFQHSVNRQQQIRYYSVRPKTWPLFNNTPPPLCVSCRSLVLVSKRYICVQYTTAVLLSYVGKYGQDEAFHVAISITLRQKLCKKYSLEKCGSFNNQS
jgi:hypothetical protein